MAFVVYRRPIEPNSPLLDIKEYTKRPITTVGKERSVFRIVVSRRFTLNSFKAMTRPRGTPAKPEMIVEKKLTFRDTAMTSSRSLSRDHKRRRADLKLSRKKVISPYRNNVFGRLF